MAFKVILPKIGLSEESSIIGEWFKEKGDYIKKGEPLFSVETDKSTSEVEAEEEGIILEIFYLEGDEAPVLSTVAIIGKEDEDISDLISEKQNDETSMLGEIEYEQQVTENEVISSNTDIEKEPSDSDSLLKISPRAKELAKQLKIDYRVTKGTGPSGRIIERDIKSLGDNSNFTSAAYTENQNLVQYPEIIKGTGIGGRITLEDLKESRRKEDENIECSEETMFSNVEKIRSIRKTIADNMMNSLHTTAQLTLNSYFDASDILSYRKRLKEASADFSIGNISINDTILYTVSRTLINHPYLNAHLVDDEIRFFKNINLGVAVDTPRGLMVPTIYNSNLRSLNDISEQVKMLAGKCNEGTILPDELKNGSFTVTNLGNLEIETFTPVLNPPQTGILGVGSLSYRMREVEGEFIPFPAISLSLTFDHRALDGAPAARFLKELKNNLENFTILLSK